MKSQNKLQLEIAYHDIKDAVKLSNVHVCILYKFLGSQARLTYPRLGAES